MTEIRAARLIEHGRPLKVEPVDLPDPCDGEVRVEMRFAGVNPIDRYIAEGRVAPDAPLPRTLGGEGAGVCDGARVLVSGGGLGSAREGVWAQAANVPRDSIIPLPDEVRLEDAAAMGVAGLTALGCVKELGQVVAEDRVFVLGASGGVGSMIVSLVGALGASVWGHTGSPEKREFVEGQGAQRVLVGDAQDIARELADLQPTVVFDPLGAGYVDVALSALAPRGRLVSYGTSAGAQVELNMQVLYRKMITVLGYGGMQLEGQERRAGLEQAVEALKAGALRVSIDHVLSLEQVNEAFTRLTDRDVRGKLLLGLEE